MGIFSQDFITSKETANFIVKLGFDVDAAKIMCTVFDKVSGEQIFCDTFSCTAHKFAESIFKKRHLSAFLRDDVSKGLCWIDSCFAVNKTASKLRIECYLKSASSGKILYRHEYKVTFNDLLDDVVVSSNPQWFSEACS